MNPPARRLPPERNFSDHAAPIGRDIGSHLDESRAAETFSGPAPARRLY